MPLPALRAWIRSHPASPAALAPCLTCLRTGPFQVEMLQYLTTVSRGQAQRFEVRAPMRPNLTAAGGCGQQQVTAKHAASVCTGAGTADQQPV